MNDKQKLRLEIEQFFPEIVRLLLETDIRHIQT